MIIALASLCGRNAGMHQSRGLFQAHMALVRCWALKTHFQSSFFVNVYMSSCSLTSVYMASCPLKSFFVLGHLVLQLAQGSQMCFMWQLASKKQMSRARKTLSFNWCREATTLLVSLFSIMTGFIPRVNPKEADTSHVLGTQ